MSAPAEVMSKNTIIENAKKLATEVSAIHGLVRNQTALIVDCLDGRGDFEHFKAYALELHTKYPDLKLVGIIGATAVNVRLCKEIIRFLGEHGSMFESLFVNIDTNDQDIFDSESGMVKTLRFESCDKEYQESIQTQLINPYQNFEQFLDKISQNLFNCLLLSCSNAEFNNKDNKKNNKTDNHNDEESNKNKDNNEDSDYDEDEESDEDNDKSLLTTPFQSWWGRHNMLGSNINCYTFDEYGSAIKYKDSHKQLSQHYSKDAVASLLSRTHTMGFSQGSCGIRLIQSWEGEITDEKRIQTLLEITDKKFLSLLLQCPINEINTKTVQDYSKNRTLFPAFLKSDQKDACVLFILTQVLACQKKTYGLDFYLPHASFNQETVGKYLAQIGISKEQWTVVDSSQAYIQAENYRLRFITYEEHLNEVDYKKLYYFSNSIAAACGDDSLTTLLSSSNLPFFIAPRHYVKPRVSEELLESIQTIHPKSLALNLDNLARYIRVIKDSVFQYNIQGTLPYRPYDLLDQSQREKHLLQEAKILSEILQTDGEKIKAEWLKFRAYLYVKKDAFRQLHQDMYDSWKHVISSQNEILKITGCAWLDYRLLAKREYDERVEWQYSAAENGIFTLNISDPADYQSCLQEYQDLLKLNQSSAGLTQTSTTTAQSFMPQYSLQLASSRYHELNNRVIKADFRIRH